MRLWGVHTRPFFCFVCTRWRSGVSVSVIYIYGHRHFDLLLWPWEWRQGQIFRMSRLPHLQSIQRHITYTSAMTATWYICNYVKSELWPINPRSKVISPTQKNLFAYACKESTDPKWSQLFPSPFVRMLTDRQTDGHTDGRTPDDDPWQYLS